MTLAQASDFMRSYAKAFDEFNAEDIANLFDAPCLIISASRSLAFTSPGELVANFEAINERHRASGHHHASLLSGEISNVMSPEFVEVDAS